MHLRDNQILYDREGEGEFFQIYTKRSTSGSFSKSSSAVIIRGLAPRVGKSLIVLLYAFVLRNYAVEHQQRLGFIRHARELGFSIEDVRGLLKLAPHAERPCEEVDELVARDLMATERKIEALTRLRRELRDTLNSCRGGRIAECRILQALSSPMVTRQKGG